MALAIAQRSLAAEPPRAFLEQHCFDCHNADSREGGLDLKSLPFELDNLETFTRWERIHDRIASGEMPPKDAPRPPVEDVAKVTASLKSSLVAADLKRRDAGGSTIVRRLTRAEYENTIRDLFDMSGIALLDNLPADGSAHGFDNNSDALDISHVNMAKYFEAADHVLDMAIATRPEPPTRRLQRISFARHVGHILGNGDAVLLRDKKPDPEFPPAGEQNHVDQGAHERLGIFNRGSSVGVFRHEDESFNPYYMEFATLYPGRYKVRASFWSFQWDKGQVLPSRGVEAARLSIVHFQGNGRHGGHPSHVLGYYAAPSIESQVHEFEVWLNYKDAFGFNAASLAPTANYSRPGRAMAFTGPGIAADWLDVDGPIYDVWPPRAHRALFGDLPLVEFIPSEHPGVTRPKRTLLRQEILAVTNRPDPVSGIWTVHSDNPLADADRLLADFLPRAFRRPVEDGVRKLYVDKVAERLAAGDCFELAMRWVCRAALCSPDFLYHIEPPGQLDDYALASRLSYFFWNSLPDARLTELAAAGKLRDPDVLHGEVERLLEDEKSNRFVENFLGQWLKLRQIAANDPDRKLYPEFNAYLQDSMVAETKAYFRELLENNLDASHLVRSDFAMLNEKLAVHYGIEGVSGPEIRRVELPPDHPRRGGFLTQAAILKITANGTTTSPVPRGAFVVDRLLGEPPPPPPPNITAIEPDVRGATTIRDQLEKHRSNATCASCHARIDPPGFALESFDVIGGFRTRYRAIGEGDKPERGKIDPFIPLSFRLGPAVDSSYEMSDGKKFSDVCEFQHLLATDPRLLKNLAERFAIYGTGRDMTFADRDQIAAIVAKTDKNGGGIRTLIHQLTQSNLFQTR